MPQGIKLLVTGDFACFTRPEMKVERVFYDIITPSAARGILEAIFENYGKLRETEIIKFFLQTSAWDL